MQLASHLRKNGIGSLSCSIWSVPNDPPLPASPPAPSTPHLACQPEPSGSPWLPPVSLELLHDFLSLRRKSDSWLCLLGMGKGAGSFFSLLSVSLLLPQHTHTHCSVGSGTFQTFHAAEILHWLSLFLLLTRLISFCLQVSDLTSPTYGPLLTCLSRTFPILYP
jgi:hypothetical protein